MEIHGWSSSSRLLPYHPLIYVHFTISSSSPHFVDSIISLSSSIALSFQPLMSFSLHKTQTFSEPSKYVKWQGSVSKSCEDSTNWMHDLSKGSQILKWIYWLKTKSECQFPPLVITLPLLLYFIYISLLFFHLSKKISGWGEGVYNLQILVLPYIANSNIYKLCIIIYN